MINTVMKSWGFEEWIVNTEKYCGKFLHINKGKSCSYHYHPIKDETFFVMKGRIKLEFTSDKTLVAINDTILREGSTFRIPPNVVHRFTSLSTEAVLLEISTAHDEKDSIRIKVPELIDVVKNLGKSTK